MATKRHTIKIRTIWAHLNFFLLRLALFVTHQDSTALPFLPSCLWFAAGLFAQERCPCCSRINKAFTDRC